MPGWLNKASNVFRRNTPDVEQPFAVPCECGLVHRGLRRNRFQKILCRECGASRFVLPRDVYPAPKDRPQEAAPPPAALPVLNPIKSPAGKRGGRAAASVRSDRLNPKMARDAAPEFFVPARGKLITPFRVVAVGIAVVALITGWFSVQKVRYDAAATVLRESTDNAWAAVENRDWGKAREQFNLAVGAAGVLKRRDNAARRLEAGLREATAIEQLCPRSLLEILVEADSMSSDADKWQRHFSTHYEGRWLVFDGPLTLTNAGWRVAFPVRVGSAQRPVKVNVVSSGLDRTSESDAERGVILAARLARCELSENKKHWNVAFEPETAFLWSLTDTFSALGIDGGEFRSTAQTAALLTRQAELNGIRQEASE